jgi:hypothetical protein
VETSILLDDAVGHTRTGDIWLFRGLSAADTAIRFATNAPVNHVGMAVVLDDLPPLMWHAELGRSLEDVWTGKHQRGVQLHDLYEAVRTWHDKYDQRVWLRQLDAEITPQMEQAVLRTIAQLDGTPFPSTTKLASRWLQGRAHSRASLETLFCAEVVASTYARMGLLAEEHPENWYDPGRFWSGDGLELREGAELSPEVRVVVPALPGAEDAGSEASARLRRAASREFWRQNAERIRAERISAPLRSAAGLARRAAEQTMQTADWRPPMPARITRSSAGGSTETTGSPD